jgi:transcriptional regulator with XRE-family HTH domain
VDNQLEHSRRLARAVGNIVRTARAEQKLSQAQVAALSTGPTGGVSRALISAVECGRSLPGIEALVSISRVLRLDPREILERVELTEAVPSDALALSAQQLMRAGIDQFFGGNYRRALAYYDLAQEKIDQTAPLDAESRRMRVWLEIDRSLALRRASALRFQPAFGSSMRPSKPFE